MFGKCSTPSIVLKRADLHVPLGSRPTVRSMPGPS
jgi:hypothetical protein